MTESGEPTFFAPRRRGYGTCLVTGGIAQMLGGVLRVTSEPEDLRCTLGALRLSETDRETCPET